MAPRDRQLAGMDQERPLSCSEAGGSVRAQRRGLPRSPRCVGPGGTGAWQQVWLQRGYLSQVHLHGRVRRPVAHGQDVQVGCRSPGHSGSACTAQAEKPG